MAPMLPTEIMCDILYKYNGLEHPTSNMIKKYFNSLDRQYNIYKHIEKITERVYLYIEKQEILISENTDFLEDKREYPRLYFAPSLDLIVEKIISTYIKDE